MAKSKILPFAGKIFGGTAPQSCPPLTRALLLYTMYHMCSFVSNLYIHTLQCIRKNHWKIPIVCTLCSLGIIYEYRDISNLAMTTFLSTSFNSMLLDVDLLFFSNEISNLLFFSNKILI